VKYSSDKLPELFTGDGESGNALWNYLQSMSPEAIAQLSKPSSPEMFQVMEHNIIGLLGGLPTDQFNVTVTTNRESLGRLLASAMMSGYFLKSAEQRMSFERSLQSTSLSTEATPDAE
jgi:hypothetical protein